MKEQVDLAILLLTGHIVNGICQAAIISDILSTCKQLYSRPIIGERGDNGSFSESTFSIFTLSACARVNMKRKEDADNNRESDKGLSRKGRIETRQEENVEKR